MSLVFHDKVPSFGFGNEAKVWPDDYNLVAEVNEDDLDAVFELTNHIHDDWKKNPAIKWSQGSCRSTSVGDIVVNSKDEVYLVLPVGWQHIGIGKNKITVEPLGPGILNEPVEKPES